MKIQNITRYSQSIREYIGINESFIVNDDALLALKNIPDESVSCVVTSPPYWGLRDYNIEGQIGLESDMNIYIMKLVNIFDEVRRILKHDGTMWLNIGDGYTSGNRKYRASDKKNPARSMSVRPDTPKGLKPKDLLGIPWRLAFALQENGWYLRSDIIWYKPNAMPESVKDRPTRAHEYLFLLSKSEKYFYDNKNLSEIGLFSNERNLRTVWSVNTKGFKGAHFATFPIKLIEPCIKASTRENEYILDPFFGSGTVGEACSSSNRKFIGIELNPEYIDIATTRLPLKNIIILRGKDDEHICTIPQNTNSVFKQA